MPGKRNCNTCGDRQDPPTGKHCKRQHDSLDDNSETTTLLRSLKDTIGKMNGRLQALEAAQGATSEARSVSPQPTASPLKEKVRERMAELYLLDDSDKDDDDDIITRRTQPSVRPSSRGKSGRSRTCEDIVVKEIDWPHYYVYRGHTRKPATYEDLSIAEFAYGFVSSILDGHDAPETRDNMLMHFRDLMQDAMDYPWQNVRNFHGVLLNQFEMDRLNWDNTDGIAKLRRTYPHRPNVHSTQSTEQQGPVFCLPYQRGACSHAFDHHTQRGFVKHVCAFCFKRTGQSYRHTEAECNRKQRVSSKNDQAAAQPPPDKRD